MKLEFLEGMLITRCLACQTLKQQGHNQDGDRGGQMVASLGQTL